MKAISRRALVKTIAAASAAGLVSPIHRTTAAEKMAIHSGDTILFQGDSITDAGRDRKKQLANDHASLGWGYPLLIGKELLAAHQDMKLAIHNRGISGNKVPDLDKRWQVDCIDLKPNILSILVGINDIWDGTPESFRDGFDALLDRTEKALPDTKIVICEPFLLHCGAVTEKWFPRFESRRAFVETVAKKHNTVWVPFHEMFNSEITFGMKKEDLAKDGIHPTEKGHELMAKTWRKTVSI